MTSLWTGGDGSMALRSMVGLSDPHTLELPAQRMATVVTTGDPDKVAAPAVEALYRSITELRETADFDVEPLRARWPMQSEDPRDEWIAMWGIPIPAGIDHLPQTSPDYQVHVEEWEYGPVAEILHEGSYAEERRTVERLYKYMSEQNYEVLGPHEEEYLTPPDAPVPRTLIRYRVRIV